MDRPSVACLHLTLAALGMHMKQYDAEACKLVSYPQAMP